MSIHIGAKKGDIAETILLPGDPMRAKFITETMLEDAVCYNQVRGMLGFTGTYQGKRVSVQGTGMGIPSISIYVNELISEFGVKNLVRIGTCGSFQEEIGLRDVILAMSACTDSATNRVVFHDMDFAPTADFSLLLKAYEAAKSKGINVHVGSVLTTDTFYHGTPERRKVWSDYGVLAGEMETAALYTLAAKFHVKALSILTVSDARLSGQVATAEERERSFTQMVEIALQLA